MNEAHFHLVVNHLPIIIPIVGFLILLSGVILKSEILKRAGLCLFVLTALTAFAAGASGEGAEEVIEELPGVSHALIHEHEEAAEKFVPMCYALGLVSLVGLWANWKKKSFSNSISLVAMSLCFVVFFFGKQTGTTGGEIRHPEIRANQNPSDSAVGPKESEVEKE